MIEGSAQCAEAVGSREYEQVEKTPHTLRETPHFQHDGYTNSQNIALIAFWRFGSISYQGKAKRSERDQDKVCRAGE